MIESLESLQLAIKPRNVLLLVEASEHLLLQLSLLAAQGTELDAETLQVATGSIFHFDTSLIYSDSPGAT